MELDAFIRNVIRRWYIVVVLLAAAVFGVWMYHHQTEQAKATALVTVLRPYTPAPGEYKPAELTFDALDETNELATRVAKRLNDGTTADEIKGKTAIDIRISSKPTLMTIYEVSYKDRDAKRAVKIANIVVQEAKAMYLEVNQPAPRDVQDAFAPQITQLQGDVTNARNALTSFETDNNAYDLTAKRDQTQGFINQLLILRFQLQQGGASSSGLQNGPVLAAAQRELDRLTGLQGQYTSLKTEVDLAQADVFTLQGRVSNLQSAAPAGSAVTPYLTEAQSQLATANDRLKNAQAALTSFQQSNGVSDVTASRDAQLAIVNQLTLGQASQQTGMSAIDSQLATEKAELNRLQALEPQYDQLALDLSRADAQLSAVQQRVVDVIAGQSLPIDAQVLVLANAKLSSGLLLLIVYYGLGVIAALFTALTVIYLLAIYERVPLTVREIEAALGLPVLAQVPSANRDEV